MISFWALVETAVVWFEDAGIVVLGRGICGGAKARVASVKQSRGLKELAYKEKWSVGVIALLFRYLPL